MRKRSILIGLGSLLIAACSSGSGKAPVSARPVTPTNAVPAPKIQREAGLESVIGKSASSLARRFGEARIDLSEGDARKLQFISSNCVLDIFLYPLERNAAPVATHIEARKRAGGGATDRVRCIEEVEQAERGG